MGPLCCGCSWVCFWVASAQAVAYPKAVGAEPPAPHPGWGAWTRAGCMDLFFSPAVAARDALWAGEAVELAYGEHG
jgi:hypothetical protein